MMKATLVKTALMLAVSLSLTGCVGISIGGGRTTTPPPAVPLAPADAATVAEIDAAAQLHMDSNRSHALSQIAQRPHLTPAAQVHLVNVTYRRMSFDDYKVAVLRSLIANPSFNDASRHAIVTQLNMLSFTGNRQAVLADINRRMSTAAAH